MSSGNSYICMIFIGSNIAVVSKEAQKIMDWQTDKVSYRADVQWS